MITRIEAARYRCFERLGVDTGPFQVVVGANGSGKTTFLDIPVVIGDLLQERQVADAFLRRPGRAGPRASTLAELVFFGRGEDFILALEAKLPAAVVAALEAGSGDSRVDHVRYEIRLRIQADRRLTVESEHLFLFQMSPEYSANRLPLQGDNANDQGWRHVIRRAAGGNVQFIREVSRRPTASVAVDPTLLALPKLVFETAEEFPAGRWLHDLLTRGAIFFDPRWERLRAASAPGAADTLTPSGDNLPWLALALKKADPERFQAWVDHLADVLPIRSIEVKEREDDHHAYFVVEYASGLSATSSALSEGTLRLMAYTLVPYLPTPPGLLFVEEPENGIHPRAIEAALQSLSSVYDGQVWVASHSPVVLAHIPLNQVLCARLGASGAAEVISGRAHPRLADWKGALDLGSLFAAGVLG